MPEEKAVPELELLDARKRLAEAFADIDRHAAGVRGARLRADELLDYIDRLYRKYAEHHQQAMSEARLRLAGHIVPVERPNVPKMSLRIDGEVYPLTPVEGP